jgi:hypothetical protein
LLINQRRKIGPNGWKIQTLLDSFRLRKNILIRQMKKIDILNYITSFRKAPNDVKTHREILEHLGQEAQPQIDGMLTELQQARVIRQTEKNGERAFQVISR